SYRKLKPIASHCSEDHREARLFLPIPHRSNPLCIAAQRAATENAQYEIREAAFSPRYRLRTFQTALPDEQYLREDLSHANKSSMSLTADARRLSKSRLEPRFHASVA